MVGPRDEGDRRVLDAARAFREGRIGREALIEAVEASGIASIQTLDDPEATLVHPRGPVVDLPDVGAVGGGERFEVVGVHAEGGLGVVYRAVDAELGRMVAIKQIRPERADDLESRARFEREGAITGTLEHPGIVPVYGRGRFEDGRPFFAMRLVQGKSLREAIADYHRDRAEAAPLEPADDPVAPADATLRALIGRLVQACFAVEYAHSRGVVHRDLKPENILLGPFGETLVVDWGLAKGPDGRLDPDEGPEADPGPLPDPPRPDPTAPIAPSGDAAASVAEVGTAAWMPGVGARTTEAEADWATRIGHVRGTIAYMSPEQARGDQAEVGPSADVFGLGATLYCLLTGGPPIRAEAGMAAMLQRAIRAEFEGPGLRRPGVDPELERICLRALAAEPSERHPSARALAEELDEWLAEERARTARALFASALDAYGALVTTVEDHLGALPAAREARGALLSTAVTGLERLIDHAERGQSAEVARALAEAHRQLGEIAVRSGRSDDAIRHFGRSLDAFDVLVGPGRPEPGDRRGLAIVLGRLGDVCRRRGDADGARRYYRRGLAASRAFAAAEPRSGRAQRGLAIALGKLGDHARQAGRLAAARSYHRRSLAIADALTRIAPEGSESLRCVAMALDKLGDVDRQLGDLPSARRHYERALSVAESLATARPEDRSARRGLVISGNKLGELQRRLGDLPTARTAFERSMALAEALAVDDPEDVDVRRDLAICCDRLGDVCRRSGDLGNAARHYGRGLELARSLRDADPASAQGRRGLAIALNKLGDLRRLEGDLGSARSAYREALELVESIAQGAPDDAQARLDAAHGCHRLGILETASGGLDEARRWFGRALELLRALGDRDRLPPSYDGWLGALQEALTDPSRAPGPPPEPPRRAR